MVSLPRAYRAVRDLAVKLKKEGVDQGEIIDALLVAGINAGILASSRDHVAGVLERLAADLRNGAAIKTHH